MFNNDSKDVISKFFSRAFDILFISSPKNTSLGVLTGVIFKQVSDLVFKISRLSYVLCVALGVFGFNIPSIFRKHRIDESLETMMHYIEEAQKKGDFTPKEKREQWKNFIDTVNKYTYDDASRKEQSEVKE